MKKDVLIGCLCALGFETIFGFSYVFTKQATVGVSPLLLLAWRFVIAFTVINICVFFNLIKINLKGKKLLKPAIIAFVNPVLYFIGETAGIKFTTASESGAFLACIPITSFIFSGIFLKKVPTRFQIIGATITLAGILITAVVAWQGAAFSAIGYFMLVVAVLSYSIYSVLVEKSSQFTSGEITYIMLGMAAIFFSLTATVYGAAMRNLEEIILYPFKNSIFLIAVLYQGIASSVIAFFMSNTAIVKIGVNRTATFIGMSTVVAIIAGVVFLKEDFSLYQILSVTLIMAGVYTANSRRDIT